YKKRGNYCICLADLLKSGGIEMKMQTTVRVIFVLCMTIIIGLLPFSFSHAATAKEINVSVDVALARFTKEVKGAKEFLHAAKGVLVIPRVVQAGLIIGGEYGEGAMRIGGKTVGYYNIAAGSFGYQIGAQEKDIILVFMDQAALDKFRNSDNWQAGVDGTVALGHIGAEGSIDTTKIKQPIVGFVFGQTGLMAGATIEGAKFTKMKK
ncbi:MAG: BPSL1445 family SYLF domain-containing lipoprotein, partial [Syntrophales bacterium]